MASDDNGAGVQDREPWCGSTGPHHGSLHRPAKQIAFFHARAHCFPVLTHKYILMYLNKAWSF